MQSHPLAQNPWSVESASELGTVRLSLARMVGNSASEPDATGGQPLDAWTVAVLMGE